VLYKAGKIFIEMSEPASAAVTIRFIKRDVSMNFEEFENLARLYVVGALEDGEEEAFLEAREEFGDRAEAVVAEYRKLNSVFALSLQPHPPHPDTKRKLLWAIRQTIDGNEGHGDWVAGSHAAAVQRVVD
jgi:hypothetical protein